MANPLMDFWEWLSGASNVKEAAGQYQAGMDRAVGQVNDSTKQAMGMLTPFLTSSGLDYGAYRDLVYGGHFDQQAPISYTPPQYKAQGFQMTPGQQRWNFSPYQGQAMGPISPLQLPGLPARPAPPPAAVPPAGQTLQPPPIGMTRDKMQEGIDNVTSSSLGLGETLPNKNETPPPGQTAVTPRGSQWSPTWAPLTMKQIMEMYGIGRPGSGPFIPGRVR